MKHIFCLVLFAGVLGFTSVALASDYKWIGQITEDGASLSYAIPQSDAIKLDFHCERKTRKIVVNFEHKPNDAIDGMKTAIRLSIRDWHPGLAVNIPVSGQRLQLDDKFILQGETRMTPLLRRILSESGTLLVTVESLSAEISLKGASQAARQLFASCPS